VHPTLSTSTLAGLTIVGVAGEIDLLTAPDLRALLEQVCHKSSGVVIVDLLDVTFLGCAGITALIAARRRLPDGASMPLISTSQMVEKIFTVTGLTTVFPVFATLEEASTEATVRAPLARRANRC
jgi:anti-sigma B factor antagonist